ncbi:MAG: hypothetical protein M1825_004362 [Sarcosagium campestre]|nr:MAG: hypothetical protein M1825_004362 [Sarcosagium campestre]
MDVSPFSDGTPLASQWPIPPHHYFDYEIQPKVGHAGSYFYHSHVGFQGNTAFGPLIVQDAGDVPYKYAEERSILLTDVFNRTDHEIEQGLVAVPFVWSGESQDILVNGQGRMPVSGCNSRLATIDLKPDLTYRFRFINAAALSLISLALQDHDGLEIIEADGQYTQPFKTDFLQMGSGERYSVLLKGKSADDIRQDRLRNKTSYYLQIENRDRPTAVRSYAVIRYTLNTETLADDVGRPASPPLTLQPTVKGFLDLALHPLSPNGFPPASEVTRRVTISTRQLLDGTIVWAQNGLPWTDQYAKEPYLVALYGNNTDFIPSYDRALLNNGIDPLTRAFPARVGEVLDIVFQNTGSQAATPGAVDVHPFHAHGAHYYDLGSGPGAYDASVNEERLRGRQPVKRDSTMLYRYENTTTPGGVAGWRAWRLRADQPGAWLIHCHVLQHMIMGMQTMWVVGNASDILKVPRPMVEGYLTYGGDVMGNATRPARGVRFL